MTNNFIPQQCGSCGGFRYEIFRRGNKYRTKCIDCESLTDIELEYEISREWVEGSSGIMTDKYTKDYYVNRN